MFEFDPFCSPSYRPHENSGIMYPQARAGQGSGQSSLPKLSSDFGGRDVAGRMRKEQGVKEQRIYILDGRALPTQLANTPSPLISSKPAFSSKYQSPSLASQAHLSPLPSVHTTACQAQPLAVL